MSTPGSIDFDASSASGGLARFAVAVERLVDEPVGVGVLCPRNVADRPGIEIRERPLHLCVQRLDSRVFDFVLPFDLPHDQLRVAY
jgi:hypothetical protein